jgi:hypothetical protein
LRAVTLEFGNLFRYLRGCLAIVLLASLFVLGTGSSSAFAGSTTTTLDPVTVAFGQTYAASVLATAPVPPSSTATTTFLGPFTSQGDELALSDVQELEIEADVVWLPVTTVHMPTSGVATLSGTANLSLAGISTTPSKMWSVTLSASTVAHLSATIASLPTLSDAICLEDATIFTIAVAPQKGAPTTWSATAYTCGNSLVIPSNQATTTVLLDDCSLQEQVLGLIPKVKTRVARSLLVNCPTNVNR